MTATPENPIVFYDIFATDGPFSPSTFKTRLTLNYKRLPYRVEFLSFADIESTMKELGIPETSNRSPNYKLPIIADPSAEPGGNPTYVSDSFDIAVYLDDKYPAPTYPIVFPPNTRTLQKITSELFTYEIGFAIMSIVVPSIARPGFLDKRGHEYFCCTRQAWFGDFAELEKTGLSKWGEVENKFEEFAIKFDRNKGSEEDGPFIMGDQISFADFAVGGILHWLRRAEGGNTLRWKEVVGWHGGKWAQVWNEVHKLGGDSTQLV